MATIIQLIQGIIAGISILTLGVGFLYATSVANGGMNLVVNGTVVEVSTSRVPALQSVEPAAVDPPAETAAANTTSTAVSATADEAPLAANLPALSATTAFNYYNLVAPDLSATLVSFGRLSRLLSNPRPSEIGWRSDVVQLIDLLNSGYQQLLLLDVPADSTQIHTFLMESTGRCLGVTDALSGDLQTIPPDLFPVLGKTLVRCTESIQTVANEVN